MNYKQILAFGTLFILGGCGKAFIPFHWELDGKGLYAENESYLKKNLKKKGKLSTDQLYFLCNAHYQQKKYNELFPCLETLQNQIDSGDELGIMGYPRQHQAHLIRAEAYLELQKYNLAIFEAQKALDAAYSNDGSYYNEPKVESLTTLALANSLSGERQKSIELARRLENFDCAFVSSVPCNFSRVKGLNRVYTSLGDYESVLTNEVSGYDRFVIGLAIGANAIGNVWLFQELPEKFLKSKAYLETGQIDEARKRYDELLGIEAARYNGFIYWNSLYDRGRIAIHDNEPEKAVEYFAKSIDVLEQQRSTIETEAAKIGFSGDKQAVYSSIISALFKLGRYAEAFSYCERSKGRALVDLLSQRKRFATKSNNSETTQAILQQLEKLEAGYLIQNEVTAPQKSDQLRGISITRKQLIESAPELASLVTVTQVSSADIQDLLKSDETLVEYYYHGKGDFFAFILDKNAITAVRLNDKGLEQDIQALHDSFRNNLSNHGEITEKLYSRLIAPLPGIHRQKKLVIVPHGALHYLPFSALRGPDGYLIETAALRILPSAQVMQFLTNPKGQRNNTFLALGNPDLNNPDLDLPGAESEVKSIKKTWPEATILLRENATETNIKQSGDLFHRLHIAAHGRFSPDNPLESAILLAPDSVNDGMLTVGEIYELKINADLVTLSACETGIGDITSGDDVIGLTRGFLYAGTRSLITSLWPVSDQATRFLMNRFYANLKTMGKSEALRRAKLEARKTYPHPFYWAAFQLVGG